MGDIPNELVLTITDDAHGVVHLDLVEGVGSGNFIPTFGLGLGENREPASSVILLRRFAGVFSDAAFLKGERLGRRGLPGV